MIVSLVTSLIESTLNYLIFLEVSFESEDSISALLPISVGISTSETSSIEDLGGCCSLFVVRLSAIPFVSAGKYFTGRFY